MDISKLKRILDLYRSGDATNPVNYFGRFEKMNESSLAREWAEGLEKELGRLTPDAWIALKNKALPYLSKRDPHRAYSKLFEHLNEAKGYIYLQDNGYSDIAFIESNKRAPDLVARKGSEAALLEVKTINCSDDDITHLRNNSTPGAERVARSVIYGLPVAFKGKLAATIADAKDQLLNYDSVSAGPRVCFLVIKFDTNLALASPNRHYLKELLSNSNDSTIEVVHVLEGPIY